MNFQGFSTDSFEQFIRALSLKVLGGGVTLFGNGPDGGREATFQGKISYPHPPNNIWDGYGVIQAKFKEKIETTAKDQAWAEKQLRDELECWATKANRSPKPDYFIYCTNVELSSATNGGRETVEKIFEEYADRVILKGHSIWDGNQLVGYVDGCAEIRRRFAVLFTPGDLLAEFAKALPRVPDAAAILAAYLGRELLVDEDARLSQAGDRSEDRIRLASVFMDLPVAAEPSTEPPQEGPGDLPLASLHMLLRAASRRLDPIAMAEHKESPQAEAGRFGRFVFLGGPGSGKSTVGQFLAQIHRAALLERRGVNRLEYKVRMVINDLKTRCAEENASWPSTPRYPFRVELNAFAKSLAAGRERGVVSLSQYLRENLSGDFKLTHEDLRDWLKTFPWLLILDGLDEVPSSSNRREVISAIQNFLNEARDVECDLMIVASSRPDGYAGEFDGDEVAQRFLLPLSKARALACAKRYVAAKAASKGDQRVTEAMTIITAAIENPLVARLMRSPLQVTFMVTVVAASGKPSESRWQLFNDYYRTIYERELHKAVRPFDQVLNERRQDIDALHHRVGFILQCRAESSGGTQADLSITEFEALLRKTLEENGLSGDEMAKQTEMILGAANQRLVFLTSRSPGRLSFDVRSLQEYMAAACITNADSAQIVGRLEIIAHSAYWRNTLLFAVGRFFVEAQMRAHRDKIRVLCEDLNLKDPSRVATRLGSRIALEILESGTIGNVPLVSRSLASCALELLANAPTEERSAPWRLADIYDPSMQTEYENATTVWLGQKDPFSTLSSWLLVLILERRGVQWASELASQRWPTSAQDAWLILSVWLNSNSDNIRSGDPPDSKNAERLQRVLHEISATLFLDSEFLNRPVSVLESQSWVSSVVEWWRNRPETQMRLQVANAPSGLTLRLFSVRRSDVSEVARTLTAFGFRDNLHHDWKCLLSFVEFLVEPSAETLASTLKSAATLCDPDTWPNWAAKLPWPIACCLGIASSVDELLRLADHAHSGKLGNFESWKKQEEQWSNSGSSLTDLCNPWGESGLPLILGVQGGSFTAETDTNPTLVLAEFFDILMRAENPAIQNHLGWLLSFYSRTTRSLHTLDPELLETHLLPTRQRWWSSEIATNAREPAAQNEKWAIFFDHYGRLPQLVFSTSVWRIDELPVEWLLEQLDQNTSRLGLLRLAGFWCAAGIQAKWPLSTLNGIAEIARGKLRFAAALVGLSDPDCDRSQIEYVLRNFDSTVRDAEEENAFEIALTALERHSQNSLMLEELLQSLQIVIPREEWQLRARAEALRDKLLQAHGSGFDQDTLDHCGLPTAE